ncbi:helix-turn-helix domain-containing protein [Niabella sp. 22666]|uniref:helix-turn-helix domain-containing protein n=1 Tax=Niabella sp. 22666 TaxID=3453954 RepID=UPI003F84144B
MKTASSNNEHFNYHKLGSLIRKYRKEKDFKLLELASLTGMTSSLLSKIENGRMIPTIPSLFTIIQKLGISLDAFFTEFVSENKFDGYIHIPSKAFQPYQKEEEAEGFNYFSILENGFEGGTIQLSLLKLDPACNRAQVTTAAYEILYLVDGSIDYQLDEATIKLKEGDVLFFDGNIPHVPKNNSKKKATLLVIYLFGNTNING